MLLWRKKEVERKVSLRPIGHFQFYIREDFQASILHKRAF